MKIFGKLADMDLEKLVGMNDKCAAIWLDKKGYILRIVQINDRFLETKTDYQSTRVNVSVDDNFTITSVKGFG